MRLALNKEKLMEVLDSKGWNVEELADKSGVSFVTVYRVLDGSRQPGNAFIAGVTNALGMKIEELFYFADNLPKGKDEESLSNIQA